MLILRYANPNVNANQWYKKMLMLSNANTVTTKKAKFGYETVGGGGEFHCGWNKMILYLLSNPITLVVYKNEFQRAAS